MPSVRGPERRRTAGLLIVSGTATGALVGLLTAFVAAPLPSGADAAVIPLIGAGLALDALALLVGRPLPPGSGRQVPQEWSRLLTPPVVAVLYGARLGVGPLTILSTWTWWSVTLAAAVIGPWTSVAVGACFGVVRLAATVIASVLSGATVVTPDQGTDRFGDPDGNRKPGPDHASWFGRLRAIRRPNWLLLNGLGALALAVFMVTGCGTGEPSTLSDPTVSGSTADTDSPSDTDSPHDTDPASDIDSPTTPEPSTGDGGTSTDGGTDESEPPLITPAELEDLVRSAEEKNLVPGSGTNKLPEVTTDRTAGQSATGLATAVAEPIPVGDPDSLAAVLMAEIDGFELIGEPTADRFLDITAASEIQPDPTEEIALLETRGFEGGWTRAFRNDNNDVAVTSVYHFADATEAEFYLEDGLITIGGYGGKFFDIESLPGARGFIQHFDDETTGEPLVSLGAAFQTGPRWFLVYFVGSTETVTADVLVPAVAAQRSAAGLT